MADILLVRSARHARSAARTALGTVGLTPSRAVATARGKRVRVVVTVVDPAQVDRAMRALGARGFVRVRRVGESTVLECEAELNPY